MIRKEIQRGLNFHNKRENVSIIILAQYSYIAIYQFVFLYLEIIMNKYFSLI